MKNHIKEILENVKIKVDGLNPLQDIEDIFVQMERLELIYGIKMRPKFPDDKQLNDAVKNWE